MTQLDSTDLWDFLHLADFIVCIPINLDVDRNGHAIMGAGVALEAKKRIPGIERELGRKLCDHKDDDYFILDDERVRGLPTKTHWRDPISDLSLIERACWALKSEALGWPNLNFVTVRLGCGCGHLGWHMVEPIMSMLPDNCWCVTL